MRNKEVRPFGLKDKFTYMMGDVGCNMVLTLANSYLLVFYTKVMGVSAAIVGTIFMLARFVDAFTDMAVGRIVDTHVAKNGDRYRPWLKYASLPMVICSSLMYNFLLTDASMPIKVIWLVVTYLLFGSIFYTAVNIPYGTMSAVISDNTGHRSSLSTWRSMGSTIGGAILGIIIPLAVYTKDAEGNNVANGPRFFVAAVCLGILALICILVCYAGSVERIHVVNKTTDQSEKIGTIQAIGLCLKDKALLLNMGFSIFIYASTTMFMTYNQYMFLDYFGNTSMSGLSSLIMMIGMMLAAPFATVLGRKLGKKETSVLGLTISTVSYLLVFFFRTTSAMVYMVAVFTAFFGIGLVSMVSFAMMNDCIDNHYLNTGDNAGGTVYGLNSFMRKLSGAVTTGIGGWGLTMIGYDELATIQIEAVKQGIFNLGIGMPAACFVISLIFMILFPLNKKKIEDNNRKLQEIRQKG